MLPGHGHSYLAPEQNIRYSLHGDKCTFFMLAVISKCKCVQARTCPGHQHTWIFLSENTCSEHKWKPEKTGPHRLRLEVELDHSVHLGLPRDFLEACAHSQFLNISSDLHGMTIGMAPASMLPFSPPRGQHYPTTECRILFSQAGPEPHSNPGPGDIFTIVPLHHLYRHSPGCVCCLWNTDQYLCFTEFPFSRFEHAHELIDKLVKDWTKK